MNPILAAILNDDLEGLEVALDAEMQARTMDAIEAIRPAVMAKAMGQDVQEETIDEELSDEDALAEVIEELEEVTGVELDEEELAELSHGTLGRYLARAIPQKDSEQDRHSRLFSKAMNRDAYSHDERKQFMRGMTISGNIAAKRSSGIKTAIKKLTKEDVNAMLETSFNTLLELSHDTYHRYIKKSADSLSDHRTKEMEAEFSGDGKGEIKHARKSKNRMRGIQRAAQGLRDALK